MKKLCIDARLIDAAGIGTYLKSLISGLKKHYDLSYLIKQEDSKTFEKGIVVKSPLYSFREQVELPLRIPECDLFFSPHFNIPLFPIRAKKRITTLCDAYHLDHFKLLSLPQKLYASFFYNAALSLSDHVITISAFSKERLLSQCRKSPKKLSMIYPGVEISRFDSPLNAVKKAKIREKYVLPERFILFVGNIKPHKNLRRLLYAYQFYLRNAKHPIPLVLCGKKEGFIHGENSLERVLRHDKSVQDKVFITGHVEEEELPAFYKMAELFVFPSLYEGFGYPPLEAMAAGCPVIASSAGSIPEVCSDATIYFNPYDMKGIGTLLNTVLSNTTMQQELIEKGKKRVALFNLEKSLLEHRNIIEEELA